LLRCIVVEEVLFDECFNVHVENIEAVEENSGPLAFLIVLIEFMIQNLHIFFVFLVDLF